MNEKELQNKIVKIRREIHKNPELGNCEFKTAELVGKNLKALKIPFKRVAKTGVIAFLRGKNPGKCVVLRADMDALPIQEKSNKNYKSKNPGMMHACGHDAHTAMLLGAATILSEKRDFNGMVKFAFQPNEEGAGGAKGLIKNGLMKNPEVDAVFGLHVDPRIPLKMIGIKSGPLMAAVDKFVIEIIGIGGHAAYPHEGKDPIVAASEIVQSIQSIVSRKVDPLEPVVITVGKIEGGTQYNVLAEKVFLTGTVRTLSENLHRKIPGMIRETVSGICKAHGVKFKIHYEILGTVLSNDYAVADFSVRIAQKCFGKNRIKKIERASMGGEDFSEYLKNAPGCFIFLGTGSSGKKFVPWHHPEFDIDESVLPVGAKLLASLASEFLGN